MGSPARRRRFATRSAATVVNATTGVVQLTRPDTADGVTAGTSYFQNLLTNPDPNDPGDLSGRVSLAIRSNLAAANVFLTKIALVDADGNDLFVVWDNATGVATNDAALLPDLLAALPIGANEFVAVSLLNSSGGDLTGSVDAVYELGINYGQEGAHPA